MKELNRLKEIDKELYLLKGTLALLYWDRATIMPKKGINYRSDQISLLSKKMHELSTSKEIKRLVRFLSKKEVFNKLSKLDKIAITKYKKDVKRLSKLPSDFVESYTKLQVQSAQAFETAREKKDFQILRPYMEKIVEMKKKEASYIDSRKHPYDVLFEPFEEGVDHKELKKVFDELKIGLIQILKDIKKSKKYRSQKDSLKNMDFPIDTQKIIVKDITNRMGVPKDRNVIGESVHPFTDHITADDVRFSTAYRKGQPMFSFTSTVHEAGHTLYELGFDTKLRDWMILVDAPSFGLHESQSRIWENQVCKGFDFWKMYYSFYKKHFKCLNKVTMNQFYEMINQVSPSLIRIEGDEVSYCLHIIIRFELALDIFENKLKMKDLPKAWSKKYKEYMGVMPKDDNQGVLQDMHWGEGYFGYFPTYALGTLYSAMLYSQIKKEGLTKHIRSGNLKMITKWLHNHVHKHGNTMLTKEIIKKATGRDLTPKDFLDYLKDKYYKIYDID